MRFASGAVCELLHERIVARGPYRRARGVATRRPSRDPPPLAMASATASSPPPARHALTPTSPIDKAVVVAVAALASTVPACFFDREILFTYHPVFMTLAFACFATIGAWIAAKTRSIPAGPARVSALWTHAGVNVASVACACVGGWAIYANKENKGRAHLTSWHSWVGIVALGLTAASPALGAVAFARLGLLQSVPSEWRHRVKWTHRKAGAAAWALGCVPSHTGPHTTAFAL